MPREVARREDARCSTGVEVEGEEGSRVGDGEAASESE
jgi:hypothetical protein